MNYYNEFDSYAAQWLRSLIEAGLIPAGERRLGSVWNDKNTGLGGRASRAGERGVSDAAEITLPYPPSANSYWRTWKGRMLISAKGRQYRRAVGHAVMQGGAVQVVKNSFGDRG